MFETLKHLVAWNTNKEEDKELTSLESPDKRDGAHEVEEIDNGSYIRSSFYGGYDMGIGKQNTRQRINTYRQLVEIPEVENAVDEIIGDAIVYENNKDTTEIHLDDTNFSDRIKKIIIDEYKNILNLYDFNNKGHLIFKNWYVDSKVVYEKVLGKNPKEGIQELRYIDPRSVELIRRISKQEDKGTSVVKSYSEMFLYTKVSKNYSVYAPSNPVEIPRNALVYAHSGLTDCSGSIIGYLHRAVKPANQLKTLEDAMMINRIVRAPERRIFYVDTDNMPSKRAEEHMTKMMSKFNNKLAYDSATGKLRTEKNTLSMTDDFWLQRRNGKSATEVQPLPGATNLDQIEDVRWFNRKMYEALRVPLSRVNEQDGQSSIFGNGSEITRDEVKFNKFIDSLRKQFSEILLDPLKSNLILKGIITEQEWEDNKTSIQIQFLNDSHFEEAKRMEIMQSRVSIIQQMGEVVGTYVSHDWVMKNILNMSDNEIKEESKLIEQESKIDRFKKEEGGGW